jgi:AAA domain
MDAPEQQPDGKAHAQREAEFAKLKSNWHTYRPQELREECERTGQRYLIDGLIPERSLGLLVGDSGLGKSPLAYQMGICVAAGIPFLGMPTQKSRVLYMDFENGLHDVNGLVSRLSTYLELSKPPDDLVLWNINHSPRDFGQAGRSFVDLIRDVRPGLVLIDPMSAVHAAVEKSNGDATTFYQLLRRLIHDCGCSIINLHHRKKPPPPRPGQLITQSIEDSHSSRGWFVDARGASVLVNGVDVRLGVDVPGITGATLTDIVLVVRGYSRVRGEIPTMHLMREFDEGEPLGYRKARGVQLLCNPEQEAAFGKLPDRFQFKEAKRVYGKGDQATTDFLNKCIAKGILRRAAKGVYEKVKLAE